MGFWDLPEAPSGALGSLGLVPAPSLAAIEPGGPYSTTGAGRRGRFRPSAGVGRGRREGFPGHAGRGKAPQRVGRREVPGHPVWGSSGQRCWTVTVVPGPPAPRTPCRGPIPERRQKDYILEVRIYHQPRRKPWAPDAVSREPSGPLPQPKGVEWYPPTGDRGLFPGTAETPRISRGLPTEPGAGPLRPGSGHLRTVPKDRDASPPGPRPSTRACRTLWWGWRF